MRHALYLALLACAAPCVAAAQDQDPTAVQELVISASPYSKPSDGTPARQAETYGKADLERSGASSLLRALNERSGQIQLNGAQGNPFQPNVSYRGFEASPLVGNAQGIAVYIDGSRLNQPFGDTVNWDLIPDIAIQSVTVEGSNPVYGLNALGGSIDLRLKTGQSYQGGEFAITTASFGRNDGSFEYGSRIGEKASLYVAVRALEEDGWRDFSPSTLLQGYADFTLEGENHTTHLKFIGADNDMTGNGTAPVELLEARRASVFTHPDRTQNEFARLSWSTDYRLSEALTLQGSAYLSVFDQSTENGDAAEVDECDAPFAAFVCSEEERDEPLEDVDGDPIADFLNGGDYAFLNRGSTDTDAYGAALQTSYVSQLFGRPNRAVLGVSFDGGTSTFRASSELGELGDDRGYEGPGVIVESDDISSIGVTTHNRYYGAFFSSTMDLSPTISATVSGRYNAADVVLRDLIGTALNGSHEFNRFNPAVGVTWKPADGYTVYGGYSESNRAPTPAELSCADPAAPCSLTNFFVGDPPLEQVIGKTFEAGVRKTGDGWRWSLSAFSTDTEDDIMFIASPVAGRAYFQNVGETKRQGVTAEGGFDFGKLYVTGAVSLIDATFESPLTVNSPESPFADPDGLLFVEPGDSLPGVADFKAKLAVDYDITDRWSISATAQYQSGQYLFGDESNDDEKTDSFTVFNVATSFGLTDKVSLVWSVENLFDQDYETFGTYSPVDEVPLAEAPGASDTRSLGPGTPRAYAVGLRVKF